MPITPMHVAVGAKVLGAIFGNKRRKRLRKARRARADIERLRNYQARRQFLRRFREAQAASIVRGAAQNIGIESSLIQGELASQATQARVGVTEQNKMSELAETANRAMDKAGRAGFASDVFNTIGSIAQAFPGEESASTSPTIGKGTKNG